ncbi:hypothetical protein MNBD_NITROSPINAE05-1290 [hydrothermal vent metagenome]|uniref:Uncharacterized protein n=1 Tax=hydrothermal vent metagenome TaxID=652676 RepID=A0A3B1D595_9ZZZZ
MSADKKTFQPLYTVMIRRGEKVVQGIPTKMLVPYIEGKKLLCTDAISGDGVKWTRLDQHFQLARYFKDETSAEVLPDAPSPFPQDDDIELEADSLSSKVDEEPVPPALSKFENQLNQVAEMLKDLNK